MTEHNLYVVLVEQVMPVQELLVVVSPCTPVCFLNRTVVGSELTIIRVVCICESRFHQHCDVNKKSSKETDFSCTCSISEAVASFQFLSK